MVIEPITREEKFLAKAGGQNVETLEPITRKEMFLDAIVKNGGGGGGAFGETVTYGDTLTWDGTLIGENAIDISGGAGARYYIRLSDVAPTLEELANGGNCVINGAQHYFERYYEYTDGTYYVPSEEEDVYFPVIFPVDIEANGLLFPKGVYILYSSNMPYVSSFTVNGYSRFERTEITQIPKKYLPNNPLVVRVTEDRGDMLIADKSYDEIADAIKEDRVVMCIVDNDIYHLIRSTSITGQGDPCHTFGIFGNYEGNVGVSELSIFSDGTVEI